MKKNAVKKTHSIIVYLRGPTKTVKSVSVPKYLKNDIESKCIIFCKIILNYQQMY